MSEPDVSELLTVEEAIRIIDATAVTPRRVRLRLEEARGHYLAEDVAADRDYPPFDKSLMDGYAVRSGDVTGVPVTLKVIGEIPAGRRADRPLQAGEAYAIMTGAPLPAGADAVVPVEDTRPRDDDVEILSRAVPHRYIARRGADTREGTVVLRRGARLEAAQLAAAATVGADRVSVFARPKAAVLATGDELVPIHANPGPAQIRNSNTPMLLALLHRIGCEASDLGHARDEPVAIRNKILEGLERTDTLFVTGGMSMGAHDYVPGLLQEAGVRLHITKLRIKPGKPFLFGTFDDSKYVFGLPGNPVSSFVCTIRLASRLLIRQAGGQVREKWTSGVLSQPLPANGPREFYQPVRLEWDDARGQTVVHALEWKGSADLFTLANADGLLVRPENDVPRSAGAAVRVLEL
jgi:molybdopterin molybdotransferase